MYNFRDFFVCDLNVANKNMIVMSECGWIPMKNMAEICGISVFSLLQGTCKFLGEVIIESWSLDRLMNNYE